MDYRRPVTGKRNTIALGTYPVVGPAEAREKHQAAKKLLAAGVDPGLQRKAARAVAVDRAANSFAVVGEELLQKRAKKLAAGTATRERRLFEQDLEQIGRAHVRTSVTHAPLVCRLLLETKNNKHQ